MPETGKRLNVLVVNDQEDVLSGLRALLKDENVETALNPEEAQKKIVSAKQPFNAVLIDKNFGWQFLGSKDAAQQGVEELVSFIQEKSPKSHVCIHSFEEGPGRFSKIPFISFSSKESK
jgi:DNA-binding NtrC family response regulator